ncbi:ADP-ribosyltransferase [Nocardia tengchongensis]|uniref:ADP-ribosyltransferase n=1 Tax=Nocardia tengchongensis TaxID=2055889 RepID=UPI00365AD4E0
MKANGRRRLNRLAQKKVADHLKALGLVETAAAVQKAAPSVLAELMAGLGIDPTILGDTPMPSVHANPPSAKLLIAQALAEKQALEAPKLTPAQAAVEQAQQACDDAEAEVEKLRKKLTNAKAQKTKSKNRLEKDPENEALKAKRELRIEEWITALAAYQEASTVGLQAARDDLAAAKFGLGEDMSPDERDAFYAGLPQEEIDAISRSINRKFEADAQQALGLGGVPTLANVARDTGVYKTAEFVVQMGEGTAKFEGRELDGGTAIVRRGSGDFLVLQRKGDVYHIVGATYSKSAALSLANRIPIMSTLPDLPADATPMQLHAHDVKGDIMLEVASKAIDGDAATAGEQQKLIDTAMAGAAAKIADSFGAGVARAEIFDGAKRHTKRMREKAAHEAGEKARAQALASGSTKVEAAAAYEKARRAALGSPTRGGGSIPHFEHKSVPDSLGAEKHAQMYRSGIRAWGQETADDYAIIAQRAGNLKAWGFNTDKHGNIQTSDISELTNDSTHMLNKVLDKSESGALTTYTGGSYTAINAAITGRDPNPSGHIKTVVSRLESAFDKFNANNKNMKVMTLMRGTRVPSAWQGSTDAYLDSAFTVGSRVEIGKVTSTSTRQSTACGFTGHPPYLMVIRTRDGLPVKSISNYKSEDEVVLAMGQHLRCVRVDKKGIEGYPTVYLVAEDLVAEEDEGAFMAAA